MIELLLEVYNYLIKPRLQNLEGHPVSSKEREGEKGEREKAKKSTFYKSWNASVPWVCLPSLVIATGFVGDLYCLLQHQMCKCSCRKQNCRQSLLCTDGRQINYFHFLPWKKINVQIKTGNHSFDKLFLHTHTSTHVHKCFSSHISR